MKISRFPSALFGFSVATLPFEVKTTNRPLAVMSLPKLPKLPFGVDVSCTVNGSGVGLAVCASTE